jgi:hypothetical protein
MPETLRNLEAETSHRQVPEWRGDRIVEKPDAAWSLVTEFPMNVDDLWAGPKGITRIGPADQGHAGYMLPEVLQRFFKDSKFAYLLPPTLTDGQADTLPKQLEVGSVITDGDGSEKLTVVDFDDTAKQMTFEAKWRAKDGDKSGLHYSWEIHALPSEDPNLSQLITRMRIAGVSHPNLLQKVGPVADRLTMDLVRKGMTGESLLAPGTKRKIGTAAILGVATLGSIAAKKLRK